MQSPVHTANSVSQVLAEEVAEIQNFTDLLKHEQAALSVGNTEELLEFADKKDKSAARINHLAEQRNALLSAQGLPPDRPGIEAWCAQNPKETSATTAWGTILTLAREARELNRLNGELIELRLQFNSKALEALRGREATLDLYGPDGQSKNHEHRRINHTV